MERFIAREQDLKLPQQFLYKKIFISPRYPKGFSCRPVLIHVNGVSQDVIESDFFSNIIDFSQALLK